METEQTGSDIKEISVEKPMGDRSAETGYTLSEVSEFLDVGESTLRNWEKRFGEFLSNFRNQYNHRMFNDADVAVLERVRYLLESGLFTIAGVKHMLSNQGNLGTLVGDVQPVQQQPVVVQPNPADEEYKQKLLMALNSLGSEVQGLRHEVREDLRNSLKADIDHLKLLLFPPELPKKQSWWKLW
jgi:DNA-binding transcriptional MerR regulator